MVEEDRGPASGPRPPAKRSRAGAWLLPAALALLALVSRLPWLSRVLYDFDSIAFAFSLEAFDVSVHAPHPPGYFLYVVAGRALHAVVRDPNRALVWLSVLAGAGAVGMMHRLGARLFSRRTAWLAAGLLMTSPLFWTFSAVAAPYVFGALFSVWAASLVLEALRGRRDALPLAAAVTGLGAGFRPEVLIVMSPLWAYYALRAGPRWLLGAGAACAAGFGLWFLPTVFLSGGWGPYLDAVALQSHAVWNQGVLVNLAKVLVYALWALGSAALLLPFLFGTRTRLSRDERLFFLLWMLPYPLLAVFVAFGQPGMLLVFLPPLLLLVSRGLVTTLSRAGGGGAGGQAVWRWRRVRLAWAAPVLLAGNVWIFSCAPFLTRAGFLRDDGTFFDRVRTEFFLLTGRGIRFSDAYYGELLALIRDRFQPGETLVLTNFKGWPYARYYLRGFEIRNYFCFFGLQEGQSHYVPEGAWPLTGSVRNIVLFDGDKHSIHFRDALVPYNRSLETTRVLRTPGGFELRYLPVEGERKLLLRPEGFSLQ